MSVSYKNDGHAAIVARQRARRAVVAGKARWLDSKPAVTEVRQPARPPVRHARTPFGQGLGERCPVYRSPVSCQDLAWWEAEAQREEERHLDRLFATYEAQNRMDAGLEPY